MNSCPPEAVPLIATNTSFSSTFLESNCRFLTATLVLPTTASRDTLYNMCFRMVNLTSDLLFDSTLFFLQVLRIAAPLRQFLTLPLPVRGSRAGKWRPWQASLSGRASGSFPPVLGQNIY